VKSSQPYVMVIVCHIYVFSGYENSGNYIHTGQHTANLLNRYSALCWRPV